MLEHFSGPLLMDRAAANIMARAVESGDEKALKAFVRAPIRVRLGNEAVTLSPTAGAGGGSKYGGGYSVTDGVALIPIIGPLYNHAASIGFADQAEICAAVQAATMDRQVSGICLYCDSPGGSVSGSFECAQAIATANTVKPVVAFVSDLCASACYWLASQARAIYSNKPALVGSIGVVSAIVDSAKFYENAGVTVTPLVTGKFKAPGMEGVPVSDEQVAYMQNIINQFFDLFVAGVAKGRNLSEAAIRGMQARCYIAADAQRNGLIDGVGDFSMAWNALRSASDAKYRAAHIPMHNAMARARIQLEDMRA